MIYKLRIEKTIEGDKMSMEQIREGELTRLAGHVVSGLGERFELAVRTLLVIDPDRLASTLNGMAANGMNEVVQEAMELLRRSDNRNAPDVLKQLNPTDNLATRPVTVIRIRHEDDPFASTTYAFGPGGRVDRQNVGRRCDRYRQAVRCMQPGVASQAQRRAGSQPTFRAANGRDRHF